ncbi:MAG: OmpA family protein [Persicimonas sp.]
MMTAADIRRHTSPVLRASLALIVALFCLGLPLQGGAQELELPSLQLERFRPATGPGDYLNVYGTVLPDHLEWDAGFYLGFSDDPMQIATANYPFKETIDLQTTTSFTGNIGLYDRFELGLLIPVTVLQTSQELQPILPAGSPRSTDLDLMGLNDWRLTGKVQALDLFEDPLGLAFIGGLYLPLGTSNTLTSDGGFGAELLAAVDYWLWRGIRMGANVGYRYRSTHEVIRDSTMGDEILWGLAFNIPLFVEELDAVLEVDGAVSVARDPSISRISRGEVATELKLAGRYALSEDWTATVGIGSSVGDGIGSPDLRVLAGIGGYWVSGGRWSHGYRGPAFHGTADPCPDAPEDWDGPVDQYGCPDRDSDGDGVPDSVDECPDTDPGVFVLTNGCPDDDIDGDGIPNSEDECPEDPEDFDDFEDDDGCPDPDNDGDGIPDTADVCPNEPENFNGFMDEDGCPEDPDEKVTLTREKLVIADKVHFETAKATIRQDSHAILDEVAGALDENPQIELLRVEGHTDSRGSEDYNELLSQRRAESVRDYLIEAGVEPSRLTATGYGEAKPLADNDTEEGRSRNRRVEFTILETSENILDR